MFKENEHEQLCCFIKDAAPQYADLTHTKVVQIA